MSVAALSPLYGILAVVLLMLPDARNWARGFAARIQPGEADVPAATAVTKPTSPLAVISLVSSMIPFALLPQIVALVVGIIALTKIKKSNGALGGKSLAIAGIVISSVILVFIGGVVIWAVVVTNSR